MVKKCLDEKLNNEGFTLLEVLVAVIILAIVSIPVLHAFVSSANATGKSKYKMYATNAAETIMEDIANMSAEEIVAKYDADATADAAGKIALTVDAATAATLNKDVADAYDKGFTAQITLDPTMFPNANGINVPEFNTVSSDTSAIFCMGEDAVKDVYDKYARYSKEYCDIHGGDPHNNNYFKDLLVREIRVDIAKSGTMTDAEGNEIDKVSVNVAVTYLLEEDDLVDDAYEVNKVVDRQIFNNTASKEKLNSIFIMYDPMYDVASSKEGDIIIIHNHDSVEANLYLVAQNANTTEFAEYIKEHTGGLNLQIYENKVDGNEPLRLRTNLLSEGAEYQKSTTTIDEYKPISCFVKLGKPTSDPEGIGDEFDVTMFNKLKNKKGSFNDKDAAESLDAQDLSGKTLNAYSIENRIYDVRVNVNNGKDETSEEWPVSVELTGTILK